MSCLITLFPNRARTPCTHHASTYERRIANSHTQSHIKMLTQSPIQATTTTTTNTLFHRQATTNIQHIYHQYYISTTTMKPMPCFCFHAIRFVWSTGEAVERLLAWLSLRLRAIPFGVYATGGGRSIGIHEFPVTRMRNHS